MWVYEEKLTIDVLVPSNSHFHPSFSYDNSPQWLLGPFLLGFAIGSRFYNWRPMNHLWAPLSFALWIVAKLLCSCICLLDAIFELHVIDE